MKRIEFKPDMHLAIREQRKFETRRLVKHEAAALLRAGVPMAEVASRERNLSPYGYQGEELSVIEGFRVQKYGIDTSERIVHVRGVYMMDYAMFKKDLTEKESKAFLLWNNKYQSKPAMYMFNSLVRTRIRLVKDPHIELLQSITEEAAKAEGMPPVPGGAPDAHRRAFFIRFNAIHNDDMFHLKNPAVWVYTFELIK